MGKNVSQVTRNEDFLVCLNCFASVFVLPLRWLVGLAANNHDKHHSLPIMHHHLSGGGFFFAYEDLGNIFYLWFPTCAFFFFEVEISLCTLIPSLCQDESIVAQWAETTVAKCSLTSCVWSHFQIGSYNIPGQWHSQPTSTLLGQGCMRV